MVAPITGPFNTISGSRDGLHYKSIYGYKQAKPYTEVLNLIHREAGYLLQSNYNQAFVFYNPGQITDWEYGIASGGSENATDNVCYSKFVGKLKAQNASLGTTLGEQQEARKMIGARSKQLFDLTTAIVRRDFRKATRIIKGPKAVHKNRRYSRDVSSAYLEWSWGWAPMLQDIGEALKTFCDPITPIYVRATHEKEDAWEAYRYQNSGYSTVAGVYGPYNIDAREHWSYYYRVSTGAAIAVSNPNIALANRLGLINLPQSFWAVQPFSFLVDKYVNIGQMIGSLTDTFGFTVSNTWTTRSVRVSSAGFKTESHPAFGQRWWKANGVSHVKVRKSGLLGPTLAFRVPGIGSVSEAASYFALMHQMLTK